MSHHARAAVVDRCPLGGVQGVSTTQKTYLPAETRLGGQVDRVDAAFASFMHFHLSSFFIFSLVLIYLSTLSTLSQNRKNRWQIVAYRYGQGADSHHGLSAPCPLSPLAGRRDYAQRPSFSERWMAFIVAGPTTPSTPAPMS